MRPSRAACPLLPARCPPAARLRHPPARRTCAAAAAMLQRSRRSVSAPLPSGRGAPPAAAPPCGYRGTARPPACPRHPPARTCAAAAAILQRSWRSAAGAAHQRPCLQGAPRPAAAPHCGSHAAAAYRQIAAASPVAAAGRCCGAAGAAHQRPYLQAAARPLRPRCPAVLVLPPARPPACPRLPAAPASPHLRRCCRDAAAQLAQCTITLA